MFKSKTPTNKHLCKQLHKHPSKALAILCDELHKKMIEFNKPKIETKCNP
jgi:hypothetical protein